MLPRQGSRRRQNNSPALQSAPAFQCQDRSSNASFSSKVLSTIKNLTRVPSQRSKGRRNTIHQFASEPDWPLGYDAPIVTPAPAILNKQSAYSPTAQRHRYSAPDAPIARVVFKPQYHPRYPVQEIQAPPIARTPSHVTRRMERNAVNVWSPPAFPSAPVSSFEDEKDTTRLDTVEEEEDCLSPPPVSSLVATRLPSMRFDDLSIFISDLEKRLCAADGSSSQVPQMSAQARRRSHRTSLRANPNPNRASKRRSQIENTSRPSSLPYFQLAELMDEYDSQPSRRRSYRPPSIQVPLADHINMVEIGSPAPKSPGCGSSPLEPSADARRASCLMDSPLPCPVSDTSADMPEVKVQPPTPVIATSEFERSPSGTSRLPRIHRIPPRCSSIPSPPASVRSFTAAQTSPTKSDCGTKTPPLSPSGSTDTNTSLSPVGRALGGEEDELDPEAHLNRLMENLTRPLSTVSYMPMQEQLAMQENKKLAEPFYEVLPSSPSDDGAFDLSQQLTDANLSIHTASALSLLQASARQSLPRVAATPAGQDQEANDSPATSPTEESQDDHYARFDDAPELGVLNAPVTTIVVSDADAEAELGNHVVTITVHGEAVCEPGHDNSDMKQQVYHSTSYDGDLGLALCRDVYDDEEALIHSDSFSSFESPSSIDDLDYSPRREKRRKLGESLWDLEEAVVGMADRVEIGLAL